MMQLIRSTAGKIVVPAIMLFFAGWMVFGAVTEAFGPGTTAELGSVNGELITLEAYQTRLQQLTDQARQQTGGELTPEMSRALEGQAWDQLIQETLIRQELERRGIRVTDAEIRWAARNIPHPGLAQQEIFYKDGQFSLAEYQRFLAGPSATPELFRELEMYYREALPQQKLARQLTAGRYVTDAELWRAFQDRRETATVDYVALDLTRLAPGDVQVSDAEIRSYFKAKQDEFRRSEQARVKVAYIPLTITEADRQAVIRRARELREEIVAGGDFAEVARRESADPGSAARGGDLGTFTRGQMVPAFEAAAFSLPVGEVSEPVVSPFGVHLIQVQEREGDEVTARHILLPFEKSEAEQERIDRQVDQLLDRAAREGLERAARAAGATFRPGVVVNQDAPFIPGVGAAQEALDWARAEARAPADDREGISDIFETDQAVYVVEYESYAPAGKMTLAEATPQIRTRLALEKRQAAARAAGEKLLAEVRAGKPLAQAAQERGLAVQQAGPFTRLDPNTALGQANAAIGAAFGAPIGQVSQVVETPTGLFIIRPTARTEADRQAFEAEKAQLRRLAELSLQQELATRWLRGLREKADVEDNRLKVLGRAV